tara:strand:+ start:698 stop:838 length:141 start_codon:yes stop_codon:yes gene_type:complete
MLILFILKIMIRKLLKNYSQKTRMKLEVILGGNFSVLSTDFNLKIN